MIATLLVVYVAAQQHGPDLQLWHLTELDPERAVPTGSPDADFSVYLRAEDRLFTQLQSSIYDSVDPQDRRRHLRYSAGSLADPGGAKIDWNRTIWRPNPRQRGAALLLHGASDSPYSMRALAELLFEEGLSVLVLRLPGHGLAPSGLLHVTEAEWRAAVRLGMGYLATASEPDTPRYLVGYSTGAALAVEYAAARLLGEEVPAVDGLILLSPAIGVSPLAGLAVWQARLAMLPGLGRLAWTDILPEYDPYKYNSFTVNAGDQVYRLTRRIDQQLAQLARPTGIRAMPPILAFQSVADATISAPALVDTLLLRLAPEGHQLVGFDVNRHADVQPLLEKSVLEVRGKLLAAAALPFDLTLLVNANAETDAVVALHRAAGSVTSEELPLALSWPADVYSLSHVALPFRADDPVYGADPPRQLRQIFLGRIDLRGERGVLSVSSAALTRLRYNPFFPYVEERVRTFIRQRQSSATSNRRRVMSGPALENRPRSSDSEQAGRTPPESSARAQPDPVPASA